MTAEASEEDMVILVATNIHLGYMERDAIRGSDSWKTFEEILQIAKANAVDFILLGGNLFHDNKPSRMVLHECLALLRKYCTGNRPSTLELLSDQTVNFGHSRFPCVNYADPSLKISIPVFSIHGNHDDPAGMGNLCALDILSTAGFVNYFGKAESLESIEISPLIIKKGPTKLALYGLGSVKEDRFHKLVQQQNVKLLPPAEEHSDCCSVFVLNQRRGRQYEQFLGDVLNSGLVIWGQEHECRIDPGMDIKDNVVIQPGSSIATSLNEHETKEKHVGLLSINRTRSIKVHVDKIKFKTVRQFLKEDVLLVETNLNPDDPNTAKQTGEYCTEKAHALIKKAEAERETERVCDIKRPDKPIIHLQVDYSHGFERSQFDVHRFGQKFVGRCANPREMVRFVRKFKQKGETILYPGATDSLNSARVEDRVKEYFSRLDEKFRLKLLTEKGLGEAIQKWVDKKDNDAISELVQCQLRETQDHLRMRNVPEDNIEQEILVYSQLKRQEAIKQEPIEEASNNSGANTGDIDEEMKDRDDESNGARMESSSERPSQDIVRRTERRRIYDGADNYEDIPTKRMK